MPLGNFLNLPKFRKSGSGQYMACCPAHQDKSASLSIREEQDGRILFHCFAGCGKEEILAACGMEWSDVMPERIGNHSQPVKQPFSALSALNHMHHEACYMLQIANILKAGGRISKPDRERLLATTSKLAEIIGMCR